MLRLEPKKTPGDTPYHPCFCSLRPQVFLIEPQQLPAEPAAFLVSAESDADALVEAWDRGEDATAMRRLVAPAPRSPRRVDGVEAGEGQEVGQIR